MRRARGCSDKVQPIQRTETPCMSKILNIFGGQVKSSVRGSEVSSEKSNERSLLRRTMTNNSENKRKIKNQVKLRSDEVSKLFTMFEEAKLENSIALAAAYTEAVHHKQKSFSIDKQFL